MNYPGSVCDNCRHRYDEHSDEGKHLCLMPFEREHIDVGQKLSVKTPVGKGGRCACPGFPVRTVPHFGNKK